MQSLEKRLRQTRQPGRVANAISSNIAFALRPSGETGSGGIIVASVGGKGVAGFGGLIGTGLIGLIGLPGLPGLTGFGLFASSTTARKTREMRRFKYAFILNTADICLTGNILSIGPYLIVPAHADTF